jgi:hypothetical protein
VENVTGREVNQKNVLRRDPFPWISIALFYRIVALLKKYHPPGSSAHLRVSRTMAISSIKIQGSENKEKEAPCHETTGLDSHPSL